MEAPVSPGGSRLEMPVGRPRVPGRYVRAAASAALLCSLSAPLRAQVFETAEWGVADSQQAGWGDVHSDPRATLIVGTGSPDLYQQQALAVGDLNGDRCADVAVGRPGTPSEIRIYYGVRQGWEKVSSSGAAGGDTAGDTPIVCSPPVPMQRIEVSSDTGLGTQLVITDVTGDGIDDLVASAPLALRGGNPAGEVYVFPGSATGLEGGVDLAPSDARATLHGMLNDYQLGNGLGSAGNVDDDPSGVGDLWVSTRDGSTLPRALLWRGDACWSPEPPRGCPEVPVRDYSTSDDALQYFQLIGNKKSTSGYGAQLLTVSDLGTPALALSDPLAWAPGAPDEQYDPEYGRIFLADVVPDQSVTIDASSAVIDGETNSDGQFGSRMLTLPANAGVDHPLLLASAPSWGVLTTATWRGRLYVYDGSSRRAIFERSEETVSTLGWGLGSGLSLLPDLDSDGIPELLVASQGECRRQAGGGAVSERGRVYLVRGSTFLSRLASPTGEGGSVDPAPLEMPYLFAWDGRSGGDCFGTTVVAGDFNGDGATDMAVTALDADGGQGDLVFLWSISSLFDADGDHSNGYPGMPGEQAEDGSVTWLAVTDGEGQTVIGGECNDENDAIHPGATESCNGQDDDCDGNTDEGVTTSYFYDQDQDGFTRERLNDEEYTQACQPPAGMIPVTEKTDCNDGDARINPAAAEVCDGEDTDCDGEYLEGEPDQDGDGHLACKAVEDPDYDCDDSRASIYVGAIEACNGIDEDCNGVADDPLSAASAGAAPWYLDSDRDGYAPDAQSDGSATPMKYLCPDAPASARAGWAPELGDCDDSAVAIHPGASDDLTTAIDEDCNHDDFSSCQAPWHWQATRSRGCGAIDIRTAAVVLSPAFLSLYRRRKRARG